MTTQRLHESDFAAALERFEQCLEGPVIPGEMPSWLRAARDSCREASAWFKTNVKETHEELLREISRQDMELAPRVDALSVVHRDLRRQWVRIQKQLERLCEQADRTEPHEAPLNLDIERLRDQTLKHVIEVRKHEAALTTWYLEAFNRDRGVAD